MASMFTCQLSLMTSFGLNVPTVAPESSPPDEVYLLRARSMIRFT